MFIHNILYANKPGHRDRLSFQSVNAVLALHFHSTKKQTSFVPSFYDDEKSPDLTINTWTPLSNTSLSQMLQFLRTRSHPNVTISPPFPFCFLWPHNKPHRFITSGWWTHQINYLRNIIVLLILYLTEATNIVPTDS